MERAEALARDAASGLVVVADYQTHGRGTRGRSWHAPPGTCLMFTIVSRVTFGIDELEALPRRISADIARALNDVFGLNCMLKAPNDITVAGRKLCGVLCTSHLVGADVSWLLCGVGLNTWMTAEQLPHADATSLVLEGVTPPRHDVLLDQLLARLTWLRDGV
jgi:BirA family transcriptional regulator, biotin operon repressor / biotin---[acetyl-CoA-carboxylase] ligase